MATPHTGGCDLTLIDVLLAPTPSAYPGIGMLTVGADTRAPLCFRSRAWLGGLLLGPVLLLAGVSHGQDSPPVTEVTVDIWLEPGLLPRRYTLQCNPPGGTVQQPTRACERIATTRIPSMGEREPSPPPATPESAPPLLPGRDASSLCVQIYSPSIARVRGLIGGVRVDWILSGRDGCELEEYDRTMTLLGMTP